MSTLKPAQFREIFERDIRPALFPPGSGGEATPTLVLVAGEPGAIASRATAAMHREHGAIPVSGDELRAFHPDYLTAPTTPGVEQWVRDAVDHARQARTSIQLKTAAADPAAARQTAARFAQAGYRTHLVVVATARHESTLAVASRHMRALMLNKPASADPLAAHDRSWNGTRALVDQASDDPSIERLTILDRHGDVVYDATRTARGVAAGEFTGATAALDQAQTTPPSNRAGAEWLGELRRITAYAYSSGKVNRQVGDLLDTLHGQALDTVIPSLQLPPNSPARAQLEERTRTDRQLIATQTGPADVDLAAPHAVAGAEPAGPTRTPSTPMR